MRTLALSFRVLDESECSTWISEFIKAKTTMEASKEFQSEQVVEMIEKDLILIGAAAVEDKLQRRVLRCIDKLHKLCVFLNMEVLKKGCNWCKERLERSD